MKVDGALTFVNGTCTSLNVGRNFEEGGGGGLEEEEEGGGGGLEEEEDGGGGGVADGCWVVQSRGSRTKRMGTRAMRRLPLIWGKAKQGNMGDETSCKLQAHKKSAAPIETICTDLPHTTGTQAVPVQALGHMVRFRTDILLLSQRV